MLLALAVMITEISLIVRVANAVRFSISILYGLQQRSGAFKHLTVRIVFPESYYESHAEPELSFVTQTQQSFRIRR